APSEGSRSPNHRHAWPIGRPVGRPTPSPGMEPRPVRWRSPPARHCGINLPRHQCPSVGCACAIPSASLNPGPCFVPISRLMRFRSSNGLCGVGRSKSPFTRSERIWAWRRNANGRIWQSCVLRLPCWAVFPWSAFLPSFCLLVNPFRFVRLPGTTKPCPPFPIRWPSSESIFGPPFILLGRPLKATPFTFHELFLTISWRRLLLRLSLLFCREYLDKVYLSGNQESE